jgi:hypothetical protein
MVVAAVILFTGLLWGTIGVVDNWLIRGELPQGEWWRFLIAVPVVGIIALAIEALGSGIGKVFGINEPNTPRWKEYLGVLAIVATVITILVVLELLRG